MANPKFIDDDEPSGISVNAASPRFIDDDEPSTPVAADEGPKFIDDDAPPKYGPGSEIDRYNKEIARIKRDADWHNRGIIGEGRKHIGTQEDGSEAFEYDAEHAPAFAPQDDEGKAIHERVKAFEGGNLSHFNRPMKIDYDEKTGKAKGYGTTRSTIVEELDGTWSVIPTIWRDKRDGATLEAVDEQDAREHYREDGGERFGNFKTKKEAEAAAKDIHELHQKAYQAKWNQWINEHWDEVDDSIKDAEGVKEAHEAWIKAGKPGIRFTMKLDGEATGEGTAKDWPEAVLRKPMGILEHGAKSLQAETGRKYGEGKAALLNVAPLGRQAESFEANRHIAALERARSGDYEDKDIEEVAKSLGPGYWEEVRPIYAVSKDDARKFLSGMAESELKEIMRNKEDAALDIEARPLPTWGNVVASTIENSGYVNSFIYGSVLIPVAGPAGSFWEAAAAQGLKPGLKWIGQSALKSAGGSIPATVVGGMERASGLANKSYEIDADNELRVIDDNYSTLMAAFKGGAGSVVENMVIEGLTDEAINIGLLGLAKAFLRYPGALDMLKGAKRGLIKSGTGRALVMLGRGYNTLSQFTQFDNIPSEQFEEILQPIFDDVAGLGKRRGEKTDTFGEYAGKMFTSKNQADIFLGLVGTMLLQGGAAGARVAAHRFSKEGRKEIEDARRARSILIEAKADPKMVNALTDEEAVSTAEAYRAMLQNPKIAEDIAKALDDHRGVIFDQLTEAQEAKMNGDLADLGITPKKFAIPIKEGKNGAVPDFKEQIVVNPATGETSQGRMVVDAESGVRIIDNGAGNHENAYTVFDPLTGKSFGVDNLYTAKRAADFLVANQQLYKAQDEIKLDFINDEWTKNYGDAKMFAARTIDEAIEFSKQHGVDVTRQSGFSPTRRGWRLEDGTVVLVRDNIKTPLEVRQLMRHKNIGHSDALSGTQWLDAGGAIGELRGQNLGKVDSSNLAERIRAAKESVANIVQQRMHNPTKGERLSHAIRNGLRKLGYNLDMNDADLEVEAAKVEKAMREGKGGSIDFAPILRTAVDVHAPQSRSGEPSRSPETTETTTTQEKPNETGNGADEAPARPEEGTPGRQEGGEAGKTAPAEPPRAEAPDAGVVKPAEGTGEESPSASKPPQPAENGDGANKPTDISDLIKNTEEYPLNPRNASNRSFPIGTVVRRSDGHMYIRVEGEVDNGALEGIMEPRWQEYKTVGRPGRYAPQSHVMGGTSMPEKGGARIVSQPPEKAPTTAPKLPEAQSPAKPAKPAEAASRASDAKDVAKAAEQKAKREASAAATAEKAKAVPVPDFIAKKKVGATPSVVGEVENYLADKNHNGPSLTVAIDAVEAWVKKNASDLALRPKALRERLGTALAAAKKRRAKITEADRQAFGQRNADIPKDLLEKYVGEGTGREGSLLARLLERGAFFKRPRSATAAKKAVGVSNPLVDAKYDGKLFDPEAEGADALNRFFDGMAQGERERWLKVLFGRDTKPVNDPVVTGNDAVLEDMGLEMGEALDVIRSEVAAFQAWRDAGAESDEERHYREQHEEEEAALDERFGAPTDQFRIDELEARAEADKELAAAKGFVENQATAKDIAVFAPSALSAAEVGDKVRIDHQKKTYDFYSYDAKNGILTVGDFENDAVRRFRVSEEGFSEIKEENENGNRLADETGPADNGASDEEGARTGGGEAQGGRGGAGTVEAASSDAGRRGAAGETSGRGEGAYRVAADPAYAAAHPEELKKAIDAGLHASAVAKLDLKGTDKVSWPITATRINTREDCANLGRILSNAEYEISKVLYLDKDGNILAHEIHSFGLVGETSVNLAQIAADTPNGTYGVVLMHNHPAQQGDNVKPTIDDIRVTRNLRGVLEAKGIKVLDHIVTDHNAFASLATYGDTVSDGAMDFWGAIEQRGNIVAKPEDRMNLVPFGERTSLTDAANVVLSSLAHEYAKANKTDTFVIGIDDEGNIVFASALPRNLTPESAAKFFADNIGANRYALFLGEAPFDRKTFVDAMREPHKGSEVPPTIQYVHSLVDDKTVLGVGDVTNEFVARGTSAAPASPDGRAPLGQSPRLANAPKLNDAASKAIDDILGEMGDLLHSTIEPIYTGSAADYAKPSLRAVGTGEGSQVYGWGLYGSTVRGVAEGYAKNGQLRDEIPLIAEGAFREIKGITADEAELFADEFSYVARAPKGDVVDNLIGRIRNLYGNDAARKIESNKEQFRKAINLIGHENLYEQTFFTDSAPGDESHLLKWYERVTREQMDWIAQEFAKEGFFVASFSKLKGWTVLDRASGKKLSVWDKRESGETYEAIASFLGSPQAASEFLARAGIDGVKYPVDSYGGKGVKDGDKAGWNYVSFRDDNIRVDHKWRDGEQLFSPVAPLSLSDEEEDKFFSAVRRMARTLKENGYNTFKDLATVVAERKPEVFGNIKPFLQDIWNAVARARGLQRVDDATAERIFGIIETQTTEDENDRRGIRREVSEGESAPGGSGAVGLAEGQSSARGGERGSGGVLAGGRVRGQDSDERVDGQRHGAVPGQSQGLADKGAREEGVESGSGASEETVSRDNRAGHERGERDAGRHSSGAGSAEEGQRGPDTNSNLGLKKAAKKAADSTKANPFRRDFVMTKAVEEAILEKSPIKRIRQNIAAIKLIRELAQKDFVATPDEQATLAKYVGWGGLSEMFSWDYDRAWSMERDGAAKSEVERVAREAKYGVAGYEAYKELRQTLNDEEYTSARASTTTAFYTPIDFVRVLHDALRNIGVKGGRFLGPSAGTGNFASAAGEYEKPVNWQFVEKDQVTGMILKALFPNQRVTIGGFEDTKFPDGFFDFAIDNVPYADVSITDRSLSPRGFKIHDYFFAKTLAKLRPGGVMAFLTSTGTLDKTSPILRQFLTEHSGKIVGAVRLPNGFFSENAGTDVASDLVIVQKVQGRPENSAFEKQEVYTHESGAFNRKTRQYDQKPIGYNGYFKDHPEQVVGKMAVANGQYGPTLKYTMPEKDMLDSIGGAIARALDGIDRDALLKSATVAAPEERAPVYDDEGLRQGNVTMKDGKPFIKSGEMLEPIELPKDRGLKKELSKRLRTPTGVMNGLIGLRKAMRDVIDAQMRGADDAELKPLLATLNETYDKFVKQNGTLHDRWVTPFVMLDKADGNRMLALERTVKDENGKSKVVKSDIFTKRVISLGQRATKADTPKDALVISYSESGAINVPRIAELLGVDEDEAVAKLKESGDAFENPQTGRLEPSWEYLSGRVRAKLAAARAAVEAGEESYRANVEALEKVQPPMVRLEDTEIKFGATWVDPECMKDFLRDAFGSEYMRIGLAKNELTGQWNVELGRVMNEDPWGETSWSPQEFVSRVLNHGSMEVVLTDPVSKKRYLDEKRTEANKLAADKLHSAFSQFIQSSEKWAEPMYERYNAVMTDNVGIKLPNNILPFRAAGMSEATLGKLFEGGDPTKPKKGREYQSDVIARGVLGGSSLCLAHCVGAGKTLEMQSIGMLGRRLGMFKKSMYVVPNHMLDQFVNEFTEAFPDANILKMTADDVKPANRRAFFAQVANGDWDAIVVKHSTFSQKLGMSRQYQENFLNQQKLDMKAAIDAMKEAGDRISVKQGERMLARLEENLKKLGNAEGKDAEIVPFEELGVDQLFVDEAHNFKGMPITTRQGRTGGLQQGDSQRAEDMHMKTQYVQSLHGGTRGVVFATGTPLSNAPVVEAYVMLKYLAPNKLAEQGLSHFDDFVDAFGRITTETEFKEDGKTTKEKDKISAFVNIPDFMKLFKSVVDIVNSDQLDIPRPKPKYHMIDVDMSDAQRIVMEAVARESSKPAGKEWPSKYMDLSWVAKLACISPRLLGFEDGGNKIIRAVSEVKKVYDETAGDKGTQLIFTDRFQVGYVDKARRVLGDQANNMETGSADFNLNEEIRDLLVAAGIPKDEVAIIQDIDKSKGDKDANKEALFAKVRAGEVRVLIGSRPKMGEGTNVQERLAAIHLLHPGWKPSEDEQAIGRIIRNGNMFKEGQIFYYLTKGNENIGSYETKNHQLIGVKSKLIDQVMHSDDSVRSVEMDESAMDRDMLMGLASGNKALMELIDVKKRVHKLELNTESTLTSARRNKDKAEANTRVLERRREEFAKEQKGAEEWREKNDGKPFALSTPDGRTIEKVKDMAEYVAGEVTKQLTKDRYDREERTVLGNFNGVDLVLAYDRWGDEKFRLAVPLLGVAREINYSGFLPDFSQGAMTAFKGKIFETVSPDFAKAQEAAFKDLDRQAKKMSADADKLQKDYEQMRDELAKLRRRQSELERAVTPLVVQAVEDRKTALYGNWFIERGKNGEYTAQRESDRMVLGAPTVKELIPLMDAEDFASPKNAATKTPELRNRLKPNSKGETPSIDTLSVGQVDFDTPELNDVSNRFDTELGKQINGTLPQGHIYQLGRPSAILRSTGVPDLPIQLSAARLAAKGADERHPFDIGEVKGLVEALRSPVAVFAYGDKAKAQDIIVEIASNGKNFLVGLSLNPQVNGRILEVNSIRSVFPKDTAKWLHWIEQGKLLYADKEKIQALIDQQRTDLADVDYLDLDSVGIILNSFANPQVETSGIVLFDTPELSPAEEEYVNRVDKTPTDKDKREVFGFTKADIDHEFDVLHMKIPKHVVVHDDQVELQADALLANREYMAKLSRAVYRFGRPISAYENVALGKFWKMRAVRVNELQKLYDELAAIPKEDLKESPELAAELKGVAADLAKAKSEMFETGVAKKAGMTAVAQSLRSNRFLHYLDNDYSYAGLLQTVADAAGGLDRVPPEMQKEVKELADRFAELDKEGREIYKAKLKAFSDKVVEQIRNGAKMRRAVERRAGDEAKRVTRNYNEALNQIQVGAAEVGGTLIGMADQQYPSWGKWLKWLGEFHCYENPNITEEEMIQAILKDISPFMVDEDGNVLVDENQVRDALTGYGHSYKMSRYDAQRLMNDLRAQSLEKVKQREMREKGTLPLATGPQRDEPSDALRAERKKTYEMKKEIPDEARDAKHLKGILDSIRRRLENDIADLEHAIATGEQIPARVRTVHEDADIREKRKRRDELKAQYDEIFGTKRGMTDAQRLAAAEKAAARELELAMEDLARAQSGDFSKRPKRAAITSDTLETLRDRVQQVRDSILELKKAKYEFGMTPEEIAALNARKIANRERAMLRQAERIERGDALAMKKVQPPMPPEMQKRYDELARQMKKGRQKLADMRLAALNATKPAWRRSLEGYGNFFISAQRALRATLDFSSVLRQAARITLAHPVKGARAFARAWDAAKSEANLAAVNEEITSDPTIREAVEKFGLHLRETDSENARDVELYYGMERSRVKVFGREFGITDIPWFGELMLKSERHYITYLNAVSAELYSSVVNDRTRFPAGATPWQKKMVADMVNVWNGSAALPDERRQALQKAGVNLFFWAPQLAISRIQSAVGYSIWHPFAAEGVKNAQGKVDPVSSEERRTLAKIGAAEYVRSTAATLALGWLLRWLFSDDDDEYYFKEASVPEKLVMLATPKIGNTTIDLSGGEASVYRLVYQLFAQEKRSGKGRLMKFGEYGSPTVMGTLGRFAEGKLAPWASTAVAMWTGKDYVGKEFTWKDAVTSLVVPLSFEDIKDQFEQNGLGKSLVTAPLTILGAGGSTYDRYPYDNAVNRFKEDRESFDKAAAAKIDALAKAVAKDERDEKELAEKGLPPNADRQKRIEELRAEVLRLIRENRK